MTAPLRTDLNDFLFAPIGDDPTGMPLTVITALARSGVDPWEEAADLAQLVRESAVQRLVARLESLPSGVVHGADNAALATRLIALLHRSPAQKVRTPEAPPPLTAAIRPKGVDPAIYYLIAVILMFITQWVVTRQPQAPVETTAPDSRK